VGAGHRHVQVALRTPVGNLWSTVAARFDVTGTYLDHYGDGSGMIEGVF
jgi:hypothetical protein